MGLLEIVEKLVWPSFWTMLIVLIIQLFRYLNFKNALNKEGVKEVEFKNMHCLFDDENKKDQKINQKPKASKTKVKDPLKKR
ncbi:hypothetical protein HQ585_01360 [candidate division KSB1 bacterium]|nr:hypothetical protein [candidate division KSB1 bacterium]